MAKLDVTIDGSGARRGARTVTRSLDDIRRKTGESSTAFVQQAKSIKGVNLAMTQLKGVAGPLIAAFGIKELIQTANEYQGLQNQLKVVTNSTEELVAANERLFAIAQQTRTPLAATVGLYSKASIAAKELGASQDQLFKLVEVTGKALAVQGGDATESAGALRQLSQAFSSGIVRAEEFNSILEGAFPLAQAAARGLDGVGGSVGKLRQLIVKGKVTSKEFFDAILKGGVQLDEQFKKTTPTIGQAFTVLGNSFTKFIGKLAEASGASEFLAKAFLSMSKSLDQIGAALNGTLKPTDALGVATRDLATALLLMGSAINIALAPLKLIWDQFESLGNTLGGVAAAFVQFAKGEFSQAADTISATMADSSAIITDGFKETYDSVVADTSETIEKLVKLWQPAARQIADATKPPDTGGGGPTGPTQAEIDAQAKAAKALEKKRDAYLSSIDPMYVYEKELAKINDLLLDSVITEEQANAGILAAGEAYNAANPAIQKHLELLQEGKDLTESLRTPQEEYNAAVIQYTQLLNEGAISAETFGRAVESQNRKLKDSAGLSAETFLSMESLGEATSKNLSKSFGDFLFDPFDKGLKGMVSGFIDALKQMVAQAIAQAAVFAALNALTGGALGAANAAGGGGFVGGLAQGLGGTANRAAGGPLQEGQAAVVGERRKPELFIPKQDGTVVPMDQVGGGKAPNVEVPVNITNVTDPEAMTAAMESSQGTQAILNVINSNPEAIKRALS